MGEKTSTVDKIDGVIFNLTFEDKIKCWELIEDLIQERITEFCISNVSNSFCGNCKHYQECKDVLPPNAPPCRIHERQNDY
jgi:hypothetical protein